MYQKEIWFTSGTLKLYSELYVPASVDEDRPVVCLCHGIPAVPHNPAERGYGLLAERFCSAGYVTFVFNFRGAGLSQGNLDIFGWTQDLNAAVNALYDLKEVSKPRICVIGFSGGAAAGIYGAAHDERISAVISCACPGHFKILSGKEAAMQTIERFRDIGTIRDASFPVSLDDWVQGWAEVSPDRWIGKIAPHPVFMMHGDRDDIVPVEQAHELYQRANDPKRLQIIPGAGHRLRAEEEAVALMLQWISEV